MEGRGHFEVPRKRGLRDWLLDVSRALSVEQAKIFGTSKAGRKTLHVYTSLLNLKCSAESILGGFVHTTILPVFLTWPRSPRLFSKF